MKNKYLGARVLQSYAGTPYENFGPADWALAFIERYGQIEGDHHRVWVLDQVARILKGAPVLVSLAEWSNGAKEYRLRTGNPSQEYLAWREEMLGEKDKETGEREYDYNEGIAP